MPSKAFGAGGSPGNQTRKYGQCTRGLRQAALCRTEVLRKWVSRAKEIRDSGPDPKARVATSTILNNKCVRLLEEMIADSGYADISLPDDMRKGFNLLGDIPSSNVLPRKATYASISLQDLRCTAKDNQDSSIAIAEAPASPRKTSSLQKKSTSSHWRK